MAYVSLYRKYRSQTFDDVVGQDHVVKTLQNAVRLGKVAHAYLFCGTRGTGKTTTARLLAKALNCKNGPTPQPCNVCPACVSITQGSAMDIIEMDAASHTGVDDIKDIRENVKFPPMELRYKVFIIDEAHQLSKDAKDAFLKTLEEPPSYAVFILATTEPQSIPITIRSRCQQFDFRRGALRDIRQRIKHVTDAEGVRIEDAALDLLAAYADGSYRDSLSLLEQVLAYTEQRVTAEDVNTVLGTVTQDFMFRLADVLSIGNERGAFQIAAEVVESGKDIQQLFRSLAQHFRNLLFASVTRDLSDIAFSEEASTKLKAQAATFTKQALLHAVQVFSEAKHDARFSDQHRLLLEMSLLKVIETLHPLEESIVQSVPTSSPPVRVAQPPRETVAPKAAPPVRPEPEVKKDHQPQTQQTSPAPVCAPSQQNLPEFGRIEEKWGQVLQHIKNSNPVAYGLLKEAQPAAVRNGAIVLYFKGEGQRSLLANEKDTGKGSKRQALLASIQRVFGVPNVGIICELAPHEAKTAASPVDIRKEVQASKQEAAPDLFRSPGRDTLDEVLDIFPDAEILDDRNEPPDR
jgi:DNA polymerase-3 subunit gamma/tau